jgi:hypothetical protein
VTAPSVVIVHEPSPTVVIHADPSPAATVIEGPAGATAVDLTAFFRQGVLAPTTGVTRLPVGFDCSIDGVWATLGTAPAGAPVVLDVRKNNTSIFAGAPGNRPTIPSGAQSAYSGAPTNAAITAGDYLTVDIVSVGTTTPGSDLQVVVTVTRT